MQRYDPFDPETLRDPYPHYRRLRADDPVHWGASGDATRPGTWYLFRHADVLEALKDPRLGREVERVAPTARPPLPADAQMLGEMSERWMILRDPPTHTRLRSLVNRAFVPRMIERVLPRIAAHANALLDDALARGRLELMREYARPLPVLVIAEILGIPPEDYHLFMPWSVTLATTIDLRQGPEVMRRGAQAMRELVDYLHDLLALRRRQPRDDLLSALLAAEDAGKRLSEHEILGTITLLLTAGNDPTMYLIGNSVLGLLRRPDQLARLRADPALLERAVDETVRHDSCVQMTFRYALEDLDLGGKPIRAGDHLALVLGSALRDPAHCADPDVLDITRENNRLAYGLGIHFCLGVALARAEGQIALNAVLERLPHFALATEQLEWQEAAAVRGVKALPLTW